MLPPGGAAKKDMAGSIKMRARLKDGTVVVKAIIKHPMETGRRQDAESGETIPAHFIQKVQAEHKDRQVFQGYWGTGVSANPFVSFVFEGGSKGETVKLMWVDNRGESGWAEAVIQ